MEELVYLFILYLLTSLGYRVASVDNLMYIKEDLIIPQV